MGEVSEAYKKVTGNYLRSSFPIFSRTDRRRSLGASRFGVARSSATVALRVLTKTARCAPFQVRRQFVYRGFVQLPIDKVGGRSYARHRSRGHDFDA